MVRFEREPVLGIVSLQDYFGPAGVEVLSVSGSLVIVPHAEVKAICFLRDIEDAGPWKPHRAFTSRPKSAGLWIRIVFQDGDSLEGMIANDLNQLEPDGISLVPPEPGAAAQRILVPRQAARSIQVLGVIGSPLRRGSGKTSPKPTEGQMVMFD